MTGKMIERIPFKEKKEYVDKACLMYKKIKILNEKTIFSKNISKYDPISVFEKIISLLNNKESLIIKKDFIETNSGSMWYEDYWSKSTYYKYKHNAINKFLFLFFA